MSNSFVRNGAMLDEEIASSPTPLLDAAGAASATTPTGIKRERSLLIVIDPKRPQLPYEEDCRGCC